MRGNAGISILRISRVFRPGRSSRVYDRLAGRTLRGTRQVGDDGSPRSGEELISPLFAYSVVLPDVAVARRNRVPSWTRRDNRRAPRDGYLLVRPSVPPSIRMLLNSRPSRSRSKRRRQVACSTIRTQLHFLHLSRRNGFIPIHIHFFKIEK